jgi:uncharacterized protein YegJ (DUF2314 family)
VRRRSVVIWAFVAALAVAGQACSRDEPPAVWTEGHDPSMEAAIQAARDSLPRFWARVDGDPAVETPTVKVGYPTDHGGVEYLWMSVASRSGSTVAGRLANEPEDVRKVHRDQDVVVDMGRVIDWAYFKNGKSYGQFTTRALLKDADEATRKAFGEESLSATPLEPESR